MRKVIPEDSILVPDSAERVFIGEIYDVYQWPQEMFDGTTHTFEMLKRKDGTHVICIADDKIIVQNELQPHNNPRINFPGGQINPEDESSLAGAQRETREETGYTFKNWRLLKVWQPHVKTEDFIYTYLAWGVLEKAEPIDMPGEKITLNFLEFDEVKQAVLARQGYLGSEIDLFENVSSIAELLQLPEYKGKMVDR
jgi:ADP-ribose pyrophosphatase